MERLKVFEGVPPPYDKKQRMVVPQALRVLRLKPGRKFCTVGRLSHEVGWKYQDVVARYARSPSTSQLDRLGTKYCVDSKNEEKPRAPHITSERRPSEDNSPRPRRLAPRTTRPQRPSPSWVTRFVFAYGCLLGKARGYEVKLYTSSITSKVVATIRTRLQRLDLFSEMVRTAGCIRWEKSDLQTETELECGVRYDGILLTS